MSDLKEASMPRTMRSSSPVLAKPIRELIISPATNSGSSAGREGGREGGRGEGEEGGREGGREGGEKTM